MVKAARHHHGASSGHETAPISAVIVARDAASTIGETLRSIQFCREIIVIVDDQSSDETEVVARRLGTRVEIHPWSGYGPAKQEAAEMATQPWVFSIDADEMVSPELAQSITDVVTCSGSGPAACQVRRRTRFLGRWMRHGDWGRDRVVRLFRHGAASFTPDIIHESVHAPGEKPTLSGWLYHEGDQTLDSYLARLNRYTTLAASSLHAKSKRAGIVSMLVRPPFKFIQAYFLRLGFLDGWQGFALAWFSSVYVFTKYAKLSHLSRQRHLDPHPRIR